MTFFNKFNKTSIKKDGIKETAAKSLNDLKKKKEKDIPTGDELSPVEETPSIKRAGRPKGSKNQSSKKKKDKVKPKRKYEKKVQPVGEWVELYNAHPSRGEDGIPTSRIIQDHEDYPGKFLTKIPESPSKPNETADTSKNVEDYKVNQFKPGNKFGIGRPEGSKAKSVIALEKIGLDNAEELMQKMIELGKLGDMAAAKFVLERILPPAKGRRVKLNLPILEDIPSIGVAMNIIVEEMAAGNITLEEAETATKIVEIKLKSFEMNDLEKRLLVLEEAKENLK